MGDEETFRSHWKHLTGLLAGAAAGFFYSLGNSLVQYLYRHNESINLSVFQLLFVRSLVIMIVSVVLILLLKLDAFGGSKKNFFVLVLVGVAKISSIIFFYVAIERLPLGDATVIMFTAPVFTMLLGVCLLKERFSFFEFFLALLSFLGVAIIAAPEVFFPYHHRKDSYHGPGSHSLMNFKMKDAVVHSVGKQQRLIGIGFAILAAIALGLHMIILRFSNLSADYRVTLLYPSVGGLTITPILIGSMHQPVILGEMSTTHWLLTVSTGFIFFCAMMLLAIGLNSEGAGPIALVRNTEVMFSLIFEVVIEHQKPMVFTGVGVFLILFGTVMLILNRTFKIEKRLKQLCCSNCDKNEDEEKLDELDQYHLLPTAEEESETQKEK